MKKEDSLEEELAKLAPELLPRQSYPMIPDSDYFALMQQDVINRIDKDAKISHGKGSKRRLLSVSILSIAASAAVILVASIVLWKYLKPYGSETDLLAQIDSIEAEVYLNNHIDEFDLELLIIDIQDGELEDLRRDLLNDNNNTIIEDELF